MTKVELNKTNIYAGHFYTINAKCWAEVLYSGIIF